MNNILMKKTVYGYLSEGIKDFSDYKLDILADWFLHDVSDVGGWWLDWLNDANYHETESNATWLEKDYNTNNREEIIFGCITHMMLNTKKGIYAPKETEVARLSKDNVIELLNIWEQLLKTCPEQIMITEDNGVYKMFEVQ